MEAEENSKIQSRYQRNSGKHKSQRKACSSKRAIKSTNLQQDGQF